MEQRERGKDFGGVIRTAREAMAAIKVITEEAASTGRALTVEEFRQIAHHEQVWTRAMQQYVRDSGEASKDR